MLLPGGRGKWLAKQKHIMKQYFKENIKSRTALKKRECEVFLKKYLADFVGVGWIRVKTFIFNEYKDQ